MTTEKRRQQIREANARIRERLRKQYDGGSNSVWMTSDLKARIKAYQDLMGYSKLQYAYDDILSLGISSIENLTKESVQKKLKKL